MNKTNFSVKRVDLFIVLISGLLMLIVLNLPFKARPFGDITFHKESKNLALFIKGKVSYDQVVVTRAPGPIIFYTPAYLLAPADARDDQLWVYGVVFTTIIMTISLFLIFRIGTSFFSQEVGFLSVLFFFIFPIHCYYSLGIMAEVPAFFSLTLAIYGWSIAVHQPKKKTGWIFMIVGMWFLILNRPNTLLFLGVGFLVVFYAFFKNKSFFLSYGKQMMVSFVCVGLLGLGILQLAKIITGTKSGRSQEVLLFYVAHQGRFQFREEPTDFRFWESDNRPDSKDYQNWIKSGIILSAVVDKTHQSYVDVYKKFLIDDALEHPGLFIRQFFVKCFYGHVCFINSVQPNKFDLGPLKGPFGYWIFILLINSINLIIIAGALLFLFQEKNLIRYWIFWGIIISLLIFHGLTYMEPRYIFPSRVALYLMSAAGLYSIPWIQKIIQKMTIYIFPIPNSKS
jgi:4-amino-4-deoxy-L-arabinose transferase-like glycosyltransferase